VSGVYLLGYVVWALNAWSGGLGMLPALEAQYLIAGAVPGAILLAALAGGRATLAAIDRVVAWTYAEDRGPNHKIAVNVVKYGSLALFVTGVTLATTDRLTDLARVSLLFACLCAVPGVMAFLDSSHREATSRSSRLLRGFTVVITFATFAFVGTVLFVASYGKIPQELGGLAPKCAYLDIVAEQLSPETLGALHRGPIPASAKVVRTDRLSILFSASDFTLVRAGSGSVHRLAKDVIRAADNCD
jgi:hypothetical protein